MRPRPWLLIFGLLLATSLSAQTPSRVEVTPFASYRIGGSFDDDDTGDEIDIDDSGAYGIILNLRAEANTEWEFLYGHQSSDFDFGDLATPVTDTGLSVDYLQLGGTYLFDGKLARPYIAATIGATYFDPDDAVLDSEINFAFSFGGGWKLFPAERFGLRLEGRVYGTVLDSDSDIFCSTGPDNNTCLINTSADVLWQWEVMAGGIVRF